MRRNLLFIISILFLLSLISLVSAQYTWKSYGNTYTPLWQEQFTGASGNMVNTTIQNISTTIGLKFKTGTFVSNTGFQPIVSNFEVGLGSSQYVIFPYGDYIEIYDKDLNLVQEISSGTVISQLDIMDFEQIGRTNDIVGFFIKNATAIEFKAYSFNYTNLQFTLASNYTFLTNNYSSANVLPAGVRHEGNNAYSIFINNFLGGNIIQNFTIINKTDIYSIQLPTIIDNQISEPFGWQDLNNDGIVEYVAWTSNKVIEFQRDGTIIWQLNETASIKDVKVYKPTNAPQWRIAVLSQLTNNLHIDTYTALGSSYWTFSALAGALGGLGKMAITDDYDGDGYNDIYVALNSAQFTDHYIITVYFYVFRGDTGGTLASNSFGLNNIWTLNPTLFSHSLTIGNLNSNSVKDFMYSHGNGYYLYDISTNQVIKTQSATSTTGYYSCIPADIDNNAFQEVICSGTAGTIKFYNSTTNSAPVVSGISYTPSTYTTPFTNVYAIINATDINGDQIFYTFACDTGQTFSTPSLSNTQGACTYSAVGQYNFTVGVADDYHPFTYYSQTITITSTGTVCNNNAICEAGLGETYLNCPSDCTAPAGQNTTQAVDTGGIQIPNKIVDVSNTEEGFLPMVYFGTLGFLSNTLQPMMILIFAIFFVLIILAIAGIIKNVAKKVGG